MSPSVPINAFASGSDTSASDPADLLQGYSSDGPMEEKTVEVEEVGEYTGSIRESDLAGIGPGIWGAASDSPVQMRKASPYAF